MGMTIPRFLQGNLYVHRVFWAFGIFANEKEEELHKARKTYIDLPTTRNRLNYDVKVHWAKEWASQIGETHEKLFILPLPQKAKEREVYEVMPKLQAAISELNPYWEEETVAIQKWGAYKTPENKEAMQQVLRKGRTVDYDWQVAIGLRKEDRRGRDPDIPARPIDVPRYEFPYDKALS